MLCTGTLPSEGVSALIEVPVTALACGCCRTRSQTYVRESTSEFAICIWHGPPLFAWLWLICATTEYGSQTGNNFCHVYAARTFEKVIPGTTGFFSTFVSNSLTPPTEGFPLLLRCPPVTPIVAPCA